MPANRLATELNIHVPVLTTFDYRYFIFYDPPFECKVNTLLCFNTVKTKENNIAVHSNKLQGFISFKALLILGM